MAEKTYRERVVAAFTTSLPTRPANYGEQSVFLNCRACAVVIASEADAEIASLRARIAELEKRIGECEGAVACSPHPIEAQQACAAYESRIAELEADAGRYRWLRSEHEGHVGLEFDADGLPMPIEPAALAWTVFRPVDGALEPVGCIVGELNAAIDAALNSKKE